MTKTMSLVTKYITEDCLTTSKLEVIHYTWTIADFGKIYECADVYSSKINNYFRFYMSTTKDDLKLYINDIPTKKIKASYSICLKTNKRNMTSVSKSMHEIRTNDQLCIMSFYPRYNFTFLSNEILIIYFIFDIYHDFSNSSIHHLYFPTEQLNNINIVVPNKESNSLVTFVINKECLQVNKDLLCSHSEVFKAMFQCGLKESANNKIEITDTSYNILKQLLSFLQNGYISQNIKTNAVVLCELFITAEKYDIKNLKLVCEQYLIMNTTINNVIKHLEIAYLNGGQILKNYAIKFINLHFKELEDILEFETLMQKYPKLLTEIKDVKQ
ncbi:speckle-type POZ protein B-like [Formica exsecta]|uniref:speckle-type POZ protein B-like n=1 Tax=Formica exsecta TaxID=72781 RepID=UPI0011444E16|nr:speckle-type POZ protein B-like [Formica exsecta]